MGKFINNEKILILYLYMNSFLYLTRIALPESLHFYLEVSGLALLALVALHINNYKCNRRILILVTSIGLLSLINILLTTHKKRILFEVINIFIQGFLPMYLILLEKINYEKLLSLWFKFAKYSSFLLPIYLYLHSEKMISYAVVGFLVHLNTIIIGYYFLKKRELYLSTSILLGINIIVSLLVSGRLLTLATVVTLLAIMIVLDQQRDKWYYLRLALIFGAGAFLLLNLESILLTTRTVLSTFDISSRNLELLINQVTQPDQSLHLSGRETVYNQVISYIGSRKGMPGGLSVTRIITKGTYFHAHNFILESILLFGMIGTFIFIAYLGNQLVHLIQYKKDNEFKYELVVMTLISYGVRGIAGTYFLTNSFFLFSFFALMTVRRRQMTIL